MLEASTGAEELVTVDNELFTMTLSSKGATIKSVVLKNHLDGQLKPFDLVSSHDKGALSLLFLNVEGKNRYARAVFQARFTGKNRP